MNVKLSVGLNDKDSKRQVFDAFTAENIIYDILQARKVDGCTMDTARGFYTHDDGTVVREETVRVEIAGITEVMTRIICNDIKVALNQESIMVEYVTASNIMFIWGGACMTDSNIKIVCSWHGTRNGFKHVATVFDGNYRASTATVYYLNRTWESYTYQTAIRCACDNWVADCEARIFSAKKNQTGLSRLSAKRKAEALEEAKRHDTEYARALLLKKEAYDGTAKQYMLRVY